ncbi:MAG: oxygenase MpaB family protein [Polyangiales bacterium]
MTASDPAGCHRPRMEGWTPTAAALDALRATTDPLADAVVDAVYRDGHLAEVNRLIDVMVRNDSVPPAQLPPAARGYFAETAALPPWVDRAQVALGQDVFARHGVLVLAALLTASLPECYTMHHGVKVLAATRQLERHAKRRIFETAQMVIDVMSPGGVDPDGAGVRSAQKVRLLHAAMRHLLLAPTREAHEELQGVRSLGAEMGRTPWDPAVDGPPINHEDQLFTLLTFSYVTLRSLHRMGVELTEAEREAYLHRWNVVGAMMGLEHAVLPRTFADAAETFYAIQRRQSAPSDDGRALTHALVNAVAQTLGFPRVSRAFTAVVIRRMVEPATADGLGVARSGPLAQAAVGVALDLVDFVSFALNRADDVVPALNRVLVWGGERAVRALGDLDRGEGRQRFHLPPSLKGR